jgi:hypothetical protein
LGFFDLLDFVGEAIFAVFPGADFCFTGGASDEEEASSLLESAVDDDDDEEEDDSFLTTFLTVR